MQISDLIVSKSNVIHELLLSHLSQSFFAGVYFQICVYLAGNLIFSGRLSQSKVIYSKYFIPTDSKQQQWPISNGAIEVSIG